MQGLPISLLLPISGIVVTAVMVAVSRKKKPQLPGRPEIDLSWLDKFEDKKSSKKKVKAKKPSKKGKPASTTISVPSETLAFSESEQDDGVDDIALLAAIQQKSMPIPVQQPKKAQESSESTDNEDDGEWNRIPTKNELIISSLKSRVEALTKSLENTEKHKVEAEKNLVQAQEKVARLEADLKDRMASHQVSIQALEHELASHCNRASLLAQRLSNLEESELAESKEEINRLTRELYSLEALLKELRAERDSLMANFKESEEKSLLQSDEICRLKESVESLQGLKSKFINLENNYANLQKSLYSTESDLISLRSQEATKAAEYKIVLAEKEEIIAALQTEVCSKSAEIESFLIKQAELESHMANAEEVESLKAELESLNDKLEGTSKTIESLEEELANKTTTIELMATEIETLNTTIKSNQETSQSAHSELESLKEELKKSECEFEAVKSRFLAHLKQTTGLKSEKEALEKENRRLADELYSLQMAVFGGVKLVPKTKITEILFEDDTTSSR